MAKAMGLYRFIRAGIFMTGFLLVYHTYMNKNQSDQLKIRYDFTGTLEQSSHDRVAVELYHKERVLCWVMTSQSLLATRAQHVRETWTKRCNKVLFISDIDNAEFPAIGVNTGEGKDHLSNKTFRAFQYVYDHHFNDADWFLKADDDTYVIMENLRYMLSSKDTNHAVYYGHPRCTHLKQGFQHGGAAYVLSKKSLELFAKRPKGLCVGLSQYEDVALAQCLLKLGVKLGDGRDKFNRTRFHQFNVTTHILGDYWTVYLKNDPFNPQRGVSAVSDYAISFHKIQPHEMYELEYYTYHLTPYGVNNAYQHLNPADNTPLNLSCTRLLLKD